MEVNVTKQHSSSPNKQDATISYRAIIPSSNQLSQPSTRASRPIYDFALLTSTSIVVWSGKWTCITDFSDLGVDDDHQIHDQTPLEYQRIIDDKATTSSTRHLALNLLRCKNTTVARETAMTFYTKNTFSFLGDHNWDPIISWLEVIGPQNRGYINRLNATVRRPEHAWQRRDGTRIKMLDLHEELYQRNPHLYRSPESTEEGEVENVNPRIEKFFAILGCRDSRSTLKLHLLLYPDFLPGVELLDKHHAYSHFFSMDLPNLIEKFRVVHTTKSENRGRVEVLWMGETGRHGYFEKRSPIQDRGWEIVETEEVGPPHYPPPPGIAPPGPILKVQFTVKRRDHPALLVAEDPSPFGLTRYIDYNFD